MAAHSSRHSRQRGQSMVELAISSVALLLLIGGMIDLGRAYEFSVTLHNAAREGARHGAWFSEGSSSNPYLYDSAIKSAVDSELAGGGLPSSTLKNVASGLTCPTGSGNTYNNPPFDSSVYPPTVNQVWLYICYNATNGTDRTTAPTDNSQKLTDLDVILLMNYGPMMGTFKDQIGTNIRMAGNSHIAVQGH